MPSEQSEGSFWSRAIDRIVRGDRISRFVRAGPTPALLRQHGLGPGDLVMSAGKIATARRKHPEVPLDVWHKLPEYLAEPKAVFPSARRDGSTIVVTIAYDADGYPVIVPVQWDEGQGVNVILSVYGREGTARLTADQWIDAQIQAARDDDLPVYDAIGLADAEPRPDPVSIETTSWSSGMVPADRPARPRKQILTVRPNVNRDTLE